MSGKGRDAADLHAASSVVIGRGSIPWLRRFFQRACKWALMMRFQSTAEGRGCGSPPSSRPRVRPYRAGKPHQRPPLGDCEGIGQRWAGANRPATR
jgi:hypothetical protein